jgi:subfamily B ATP-binding cassette protein MsbA
MFKPIIDVLKYIKIFELYLGVRVYFIFALSIIASFFEGIGILMLLPLLQSLDNNSGNIEQGGVINDFLYSLISFLGFEESILSILIIIASAFLIKGLITFFALGVRAFLIGQLLKEIKVKLFDLYSKMSYKYFSSKNSGDFINLINEQPTQSLEAFKQLTILGSQLINTIVLMSLAFIITFSFGIMALLLGVVLLVLFLKMNSFVQNLSRIAAKENGILTKWLIQALHGYKYLTSTSQINLLKKRINSSISVLIGTQIKSGIAGAFTQSVREPIAVMFIVVIIYFQIFIFGLRLEPILVSIALFYRALNSTLAVQSAFQGTFQYIGSMELVHNEFINQQKNKSNDGNESIIKFSKKIRFDDVSFKYDNSNTNALQNISFSIENKSTIAIVGESGSGKTSLADLITLLNSGYTGNIFIDGLDAKKIKKSTWRNQIGYVSQDTLIFDDTISNNISMWGGDMSKDLKLRTRIENAAKKANILDFINSLPDGFNTKVGDRGVLLSGGQKQRIFIARELFRQPKILILDEATSSLDSESEKSIQESIESLKGEITVVIIAHRLSTIKNVDKIYLLENGKIVESGKYSELKNNINSKFSKLVNLQIL